jgi:hypothetical protein
VPFLPLLVGLALASPPDRGEVDATLDALHRAAAEADADTYFGLFTDDAVFLGTDPGEIWDLPAFRTFAAEAFAEAPAWAYTPVHRDVSFDARGRTAWFHEGLTHDRYGTVRGSGVLVREGGRWKVAQYVLSFPIPNGVALDVIALIAADATGQTAAPLPPPFTAAQIRASCRPGTVVTTRTTEGEATSWSQTTFTAGDEVHATYTSQAVDAQGLPITDAVEGRATWEELREHAAFPSGRTEWGEALLQLPLGEVPTRWYRVTSADEVRTFWFSTSHPGPPVRMTVERREQPVLESVVLSWSTPGE